MVDRGNDHWKSQKRTGDARPKRVEQVIETGKALVKPRQRDWGADVDRAMVVAIRAAATCNERAERGTR